MQICANLWKFFVTLYFILLQQLFVFIPFYTCGGCMSRSLTVYRLRTLIVLRGAAPQTSGGAPCGHLRSVAESYGYACVV